MIQDREHAPSDVYIDWLLLHLHRIVFSLLTLTFYDGIDAKILSLWIHPDNLAELYCHQLAELLFYRLVVHSKQGV